jgi:hypothetical protein
MTKPNASLASAMKMCLDVEYDRLHQNQFTLSSECKIASL